MKMKLAGAAAALFLAVAFPLSASATIATITYTGTIDNSSYDGLGLFGPVGGSLYGDAISVVYTLDTTLGTYSSLCGSGTCTNQLNYNGLTSPLSATLTINGATANFFGTSSSDDEASQTSASLQSYSGQVILDNYGSTYLFTSAISTTNANLFPLNLTTPFDVVAGPDASLSGTFAITGGGGGESYAATTFNNVELTVSAAPEPATWLLMFLGIGAVGGALRMRRREFNSLATA